MATCNTNSLLADGRLFQQLGGGLSQTARLALLKQILLAANPAADTSVNTLLESGKCFTCLTPGQQRIVKLQLLCEILNAEGGGDVMPTDMLMWLKQEGIESYIDGAEITTWFDSSGNGNNGQSGGVEGGPVKAVNGINGLAAAEVPTDELQLGLESQEFYSGASPRTVFAVWQKNGAGIAVPTFVCGSGVWNNNELSALYARNDVNGGNCSPYHASFATDTFGNLVNVADQGYADAFRYDGTNISVWRNGVNVNSEAKALATAGTIFYIFNGTVQDPFFFGFIAEVIVWNRALTDGEMAATFNYLNTKYGL